MVYVGKGGDAAPDSGSEAGMKLPPEYTGTRFDKNGEVRGYEEDGEALRRAEELFRRGYVFEGEAAEGGIENSGAEERPATSENRAQPPADEAGGAKKANEAKEAAARPQPNHPKRRDNAPPTVRGALSGLFGMISAEEILIGAIILMLLVNGADDELLIMLVILLFC